MKHLDLFSGYGGFTIPGEKHGIETIGFSEIDKYASSVLKYNFSNIPNYGNICDIDFKQFNGEIDLITGGSPCQDLSVAGKRAGLKGGRSGLFFEFIRAITESNPKYFVWENVKGAFSSNKGWDFAQVQIEMEQAGYDVWWQLLNAKDFGVPQNRERIFAIGIRKGSGREILFEQRESEQNPKEIIKGSQGSRVYNTDCAVSQKALGGGQGAKTGLYAITASKRRTQFDASDTVSTLTSYFRGSPDGDGRSGVLESRRSQIAVPMRWSRTEKGKQARREAQRNGKDYTPFNGGNRKLTESTEDVSGCITNALNKDSLLKQDMRIRRLTPVECERLMGLEDGWTAKGIMDGKEVDISDTQRYKMCGNGVVVNCVDYIYKILKER